MVPLATYDRPSHGFFSGYNPVLVLLIVVMSCYGISVSYAYKLSNVFVKNLSSSASLCVVWSVECALGYESFTGSSVIGVAVIICATRLYFFADEQ